MAYLLENEAAKHVRCTLCEAQLAFQGNTPAIRQRLKTPTPGICCIITSHNEELTNNVEVRKFIDMFFFLINMLICLINHQPLTQEHNSFVLFFFPHIGHGSRGTS